MAEADSEFDPKKALEAERRTLVAQLVELADKHERIVDHTLEGRALFQRMRDHGDLATLTLDLYQALPGLAVSPAQAIEALAVLIDAMAALSTIQDELEQLEFAHRWIHAEIASNASAIAMIDDALAQIASEATARPDRQPEYAAASASGG